MLLGIFIDILIMKIPIYFKFAVIIIVRLNEIICALNSSNSAVWKGLIRAH